MKEKMFVIPGMFVPSNDTVTLLTYRRLKHLDLDLDVFALRGKEDKGIAKELSKDKCYKKFNIKYFCDYDKTITISKPMLLPLGLINMQRYVFASLKQFEKSSYKYLYTSSIPGISHICGYKIKKKHPDVKWFASFSDPIKGSPYKKDPNLKKRSLFYRIAFNVGSFIYMNNRYEEVAIKNADKLIFICEEQRDFTANQYPKKKEDIIKRSIVLPLCYDKDWDMYKELMNCPKVNNIPKQAVHLGRLYGLRRIDTFLEALKEMKKNDSELSKKIVFHQYSEIQKEDIDYIKKNNLGDVFVVHEKVPYQESLRIMKEADILVLFDTLMEDEQIQPYLPSKIIEYIILNKPIIALCSKNSPSYRILKKIGYKNIAVVKEDIKIQIRKIIENDSRIDIDISSLESKGYILPL